MKVIEKNSLLLQSILFIALSSAIIAATWYNYANPKQEANQLELYKIKALKSCNKKTGELGFISATDNKIGQITITKSDLSEWNTDIAAASYIASECQDFNMVHFCIGSICKDVSEHPVYGISMTLKYAGSVAAE